MLALTGRSTIALTVLGTVAVLAGTVVTWRWGRRRRFLLRPLGVLLTEAMLVLTVGLVVNRSEQFYPGWEALIQDVRTSGTTFAAAPGELDAGLRDRAGTDAGQSIALAWQPSGWADWHLAGAPTVVTPAGYLQHPGWRYPALVVIDDRTAGWTPTAEAAAARTATATGPAVVVFARTTAATDAGTLAATLPAALGHDLRVTGRRWALVASASDAGLARRTITAAPGRYPAVALVPVPSPPSHPKATTIGPLPAGIEVHVAGADALPAALLWADQQTPPPLALSAPATKYIPPRHHPKGHPNSKPPTHPGGRDVAGQPRH